MRRESLQERKITGRRPAEERPSREQREEAERVAGQMLLEAKMVAGTRGDIAKLEGAVKRSERFAAVMDSGLIDPILSLAPGVGDIPASAAGLYIIAEAFRAGVPEKLLFKMLFNLSFDAIIGTVPFFGDIWDFFHKANKKNAQIIRDYLEKTKEELALESSLNVS